MVRHHQHLVNRRGASRDFTLRIDPNNINFNYKGKKNSKKYKEWKKKKSALTHHDGLPKFSRQAYAVRPRVVVSGRYWKISTGSEIPFRKATLALQTERSSSGSNSGSDASYKAYIASTFLVVSSIRI